MSEFTSGYLFLKRDEEKVRQSPPPKLVYPQDDSRRPLRDKLYGKLPDEIPHFFIKTLNEKWSALLIDNTGGATTESKRSLDQWILESSKQFPLLHFETHDEGFDYHLYSEGIEKASLEMNIAIEFSVRVDLVEERYPDIEDPYIFFDQNPEINEALRLEVENSAEYQAHVAQQYQHKNVAAFEVFDVSSQVIAELEQTLSVESYFADRLGQVEKFKEILGFPEMSWVSYHYESRDLHE
ncbi:MAG: hypothetical protein K8L91_18270 [Anaerolineae bacterium]|nr:hypothetical protein [Anaerolineae bacterium]